MVQGLGEVAIELVDWWYRKREVLGLEEALLDAVFESDLEAKLSGNR